MSNDLMYDVRVVRARMRLVEDAGRLLARLGDDAFCLGFCTVKTLLTALCSGQAVRNLRLPLFDGGHNRRPYELHAEPDKHDHRDRLAYESHINIH